MAIQDSIVIDTNVLVSAFRSKPGFAYELLTKLESGRFEVCLSVPLVCEYEEVLKRQSVSVGISTEVIDAFLDALCVLGRQALIYFNVEPDEADPDDRIVLKAAIAAGAGAIVTYNKRHFSHAGEHGIRLLTPREFLKELDAVP